METNVEKISINGVEYVRADAVAPSANGKRAVVVVDRGWIFAGDVERKDGRIYLTRAVNVVSWSGLYFDGMVSEPKKAKIRKVADLNMPADVEMFSVPVVDDWGL